MSERTGLGPMEVAILQAVAAVSAQTADPVKTTRVLDHLEVVERFGPRYAVQAMQDLGVPWSVPVRLLDLHGNWGSPDPYDSMADPRYTAVVLSPSGALALAAERRDTGPVPVELVNGSVHQGGRVPPLDPGRALGLLQRLLAGEELSEDAFEDLLRLPSGGTVSGDLRGLYAGRRARVLLGCRIIEETTETGRALVAVGTPPEVSLQEIENNLESRHRMARELASGRLPERYRRHLEADAAALAVSDIHDETCHVDGTRLVVAVRDGADLDAVETWMRSVWPVTVEAEWHVPGGIRARFDHWARLCREDASGLDRLLELLPDAGRLSP